MCEGGRKLVMILIDYSCNSCFILQSFDDYMKKINDILSQKLSAIQLLQDQIIAYQLSMQDIDS